MKRVLFGPKKDIPGYELESPTGSKLALIFVQEWWGITPVVKQQAALFAERGGFRVLVPDIYKGKIGVNREEASHLLTSLDYHLAVEEICHAVAYLQTTGSEKVGISGSCMGGALAFAAAQLCPGIARAAPVCGTPAREMPWIKPTEIKVPVQYHTGMLDNIRGFSCPQSAVMLCKAMKDAGCQIELFLYEDTPHSFLNALTKEGGDFLVEFGYDTPPQDQVWLCFNRLIDFFQRM